MVTIETNDTISTLLMSKIYIIKTGGAAIKYVHNYFHSRTQGLFDAVILPILCCGFEWRNNVQKKSLTNFNMYFELVKFK